MIQLTTDQINSFYAGMHQGGGGDMNVMRMGEAGDDHRMGTSYTYHFQNGGYNNTSGSVTMKIRVYTNNAWSVWTPMSQGSDNQITTDPAVLTSVQVQVYFSASSSKYYTFTNGLITSIGTSLTFQTNNSYKFQYNSVTSFMYIYIYGDTSYSSSSSQGYRSLANYTTTP
jgi:hypothetical protein